MKAGSNKIKSILHRIATEETTPQKYPTSAERLLQLTNNLVQNKEALVAAMSKRETTSLMCALG